MPFVGCTMTVEKDLQAPSFITPVLWRIMYVCMYVLRIVVGSNVQLAVIHTESYSISDITE